MARHRSGLTRRGLLAAAGSGVTALAGCSAPGQGSGQPASTDADGDTAAAAADGTAASTGTAGPAATQSNGSGRYTRVYREVAGSVAILRPIGPSGYAGQGSGFAFDDEHFVTNQHVVEDASSVEVRFREGEWASADVVGSDVYSDLAALRVPDIPEYAIPVPLTSTRPAIGQEVLAIGSPFGLEASMTRGIVSGVNRSMPTEAGFTIADAIQTDAAVNPGNSGGPLVDLDGRALGVVRSASGENIGFAISAALVDRVVPSLVETGSYTHPFLGIRLVTVSPAVARANDLDRARGILVVEVLEDGPSAGVLQGSPGEDSVDGVTVPTGGDVIVGLAGRSVDTDEELGSVLALQTSPGETIPVSVIRDGERRTLEVALGERPPPPDVG